MLDGSLRAGLWPFLSRPVRLGLTCGSGCPVGVVRACRPFLRGSHARLLQAPSGAATWGDAPAQAACRSAWGSGRTLLGWVKLNHVWSREEL